MLKLIGIFSASMVSLGLCKEYLNMATFKIPLIKSGTFRYIERLPMSSYTGVTND